MVVELVHVGRHKDPTDGAVDPLWKLDVCVRQVREKDRQDSVKQVERHRRACHEHGDGVPGSGLLELELL